MSYVKDVFGSDLQLFDKVFVGFEDQFRRLAKLHDELPKNAPSYPPYNIIKLDETRYVVEIAVAGFTMDDLAVEFAEDKLTISGSAKPNTSEEYLYRGIGARNFTRSFVLNDQIVVRDAVLADGMLRVNLERVVPDHKKPRKIELKTPARQLLQE